MGGDPIGQGREKTGKPDKPVERNIKMMAVKVLEDVVSLTGARWKWIDEAHVGATINELQQAMRVFPE